MFSAGRGLQLGKLTYHCKFVLDIIKYRLIPNRLTKYVDNKLDIRKTQISYMYSLFSF